MGMTKDKLCDDSLAMVRLKCKEIITADITVPYSSMDYMKAKANEILTELDAMCDRYNLENNVGSQYDTTENN